MKKHAAVWILCCSVALSAEARISIIPAPVEMKESSGIFLLSPDTTVAVDSAFEGKGEGLETALHRYLGAATGYSLGHAAASDATLVLSKISGKNGLPPEGYRLTVTPKRIQIEASSSAGAFYAVQTVRQLLPPEIFARTKQSGVNWTIPCVTILDYPRFQWRGLHMDVSRHFFGPDYVKHYIDLLALHKMNTFHWHLCDGDGWRIEIKKYPLLTEKGSSRSHTINYGRPMFYTQNEIREIVKYAAARHVNIVPEIEIPGHEQSAVQVYPEWGARNNGQLGNVFNIRDTTVQALKDILDEVTDLFPSPYIHCGGDEVGASWVWQKDPESKAKAQRLGLKDAHQIQTWLMNEMASFLASKGRRMVGWGEIAGDKLSKKTIVMAWRGAGDTGISAAKQGFDVVMAPNAYTYFNHRQAPNEGGSGRSALTLERVYSFDPSVPDQLSAEQARHILGCQGQLWSELIPNDARMDYMAYPRGTALSEIAWTPQDKRSYKDFCKRLATHLRRLDELKVNYRIPADVTIKEREGAIILSSGLKDAIIYYTTDGTVPTETSLKYTGPIPDANVAILQARVAANGKEGPVARYVGITTPPLRPDTCKIDGSMRIESLKPGEKNVGGWGNASGKLIWKIRFDRSGVYELSGRFSSTMPAEMNLLVGKQNVRFDIPKLKGWHEPVKIGIGTVEIPKPGVYPVVLSVANRKGYKGINLWEIEFDPIK